MLKIAGVILCEIIIYALLRQIKPEIAIITQIASVVVLLFMIGDDIRDALSVFDSFFSSAGDVSNYIPVLFRVLGITLITQFSSDMCKDAGESALATKVEFAGKVMITAAGLPVIKGFTGFVAEMLNGI